MSQATMDRSSVYASNYRNLWKEVKRIKPNTKTVAASVDGAVNSKDIIDIFKRKYEDLYNCNKSCVNNMNAVLLVMVLRFLLM